MRRQRPLACAKLVKLPCDPLEYTASSHPLQHAASPVPALTLTHTRLEATTHPTGLSAWCTGRSTLVQKRSSAATSRSICQRRARTLKPRKPEQKRKRASELQTPSRKPQQTTESGLQLEKEQKAKLRLRKKNRSVPHYGREWQAVNLHQPV